MGVERAAADIGLVNDLLNGDGAVGFALQQYLQSLKNGRPCFLLLGFVAYGLSINFYIKAQKDLGAAKTSAYYSIAPFLGVAFGILLLNERPGIQFYVGLVIMIIATVLMVKDTITLQHTHEHYHVHIHEHRHGDLVHAHVHEHCHTHTHIHEEDESIHDHSYDGDDGEDHCHNHKL